MQLYACGRHQGFTWRSRDATSASLRRLSSLMSNGAMPTSTPCTRAGTHTRTSCSAHSALSRACGTMHGAVAECVGGKQGSVPRPRAWHLQPYGRLAPYPTGSLGEQGSPAAPLCVTRRQQGWAGSRMCECSINHTFVCVGTHCSREPTNCKLQVRLCSGKEVVSGRQGCFEVLTSGLGQ